MSRRSLALSAKSPAVPPPLSAQRPCDAQIGQLSLWWRPTVADDQRAQILAKLHAIKPNRRCTRIRHGAARAVWERRGAACLDAPDATELTDRNRRSHRHVVRVYYRSIGDELLCFEAHDLTDREATSLRDSLPRTATERWKADDSEEKIPAIRQGARLVVLPSQRTDPVQVIEFDGVTLYPSEIREMESMLARAGYSPEHAVSLNAEGMGPFELRVYLSIPSGIGSLEYTHGFQRRDSQVGA